jgi:ABC-type polysaccharide/polyol phosphate transport system ATPase subunit
MIAIEAKNISKIYKIYEKPIDQFKELFSKKKYHREHAALQNINFTIEKGETIGIIGENGAGKSTLLKVLSRTLKPTTGNLEVNGRVASILELGAGFNIELSGEENIYLNAYLMGLTKEEIDAKKQEIIDFAELGDFINMPVKTYSSGMYVRLAFSIATSVDPDILIIDEALSVGDEYFQKKCINRMISFKNSGKTILFCSHSMYVIKEFCDKAMWIKKGCLEKFGEINETIELYENFLNEKKYFQKEKEKTLSEEKILSIKKVSITEQNINDKLKFYIEVENFSNKKNFFHIAVIFKLYDGTLINGITTKLENQQPFEIDEGDIKHFLINVENLSCFNGFFNIEVGLIDDSGFVVYDQKNLSNIQICNDNIKYGFYKLNFEILENN